MTPEEQHKEKQQWMAATLSKVLELLHPVIVYQVAEAMRVFADMAGAGLLTAHAEELGNNPDFIALLISLRDANPELNEALLFARAVTIWKEGSANGQAGPGLGDRCGDDPGASGGGGDELRGDARRDEVDAGRDSEALVGAPGAVVEDGGA
ncbi:MAG TPA: hypothetical protein PLI98_09465 [Candidatus Hydrogenedentes bacterium]|nr:hypothetical protein [Candidatus Hydrogenedentota bacterium]